MSENPYLTRVASSKQNAENDSLSAIEGSVRPRHPSRNSSTHFIAHGTSTAFNGVDLQSRVTQGNACHCSKAEFLRRDCSCRALTIRLSGAPSHFNHWRGRQHGFLPDCSPLYP